jgi:hypothetical protein
MIELPLSVIAWLSVVVVQAVLHYVVLGARRGRVVSGPEEEPSLEECLSLGTDDTPEATDASFALKDSGYECSVISADPSTPLLMGAKEMINPDPDLLLELLEQTGSDLFKVSDGSTKSFGLGRYDDALIDKANLFRICGRGVPSSLGSNNMLRLPTKFDTTMNTVLKSARWETVSVHYTVTKQYQVEPCKVELATTQSYYILNVLLHDTTGDIHTRFICQNPRRFMSYIFLPLVGPLDFLHTRYHCAMMMAAMLYFRYI